MTDKQIEIAARRLCEIRGIDPDKRVSHGADPSPDGVICDVLLYSKAWQRAVREVKAHLAILDAMNYAYGMTHHDDAVRYITENTPI